MKVGSGGSVTAGPAGHVAPAGTAGGPTTGFTSPSQAQIVAAAGSICGIGWAAVGSVKMGQFSAWARMPGILQTFESVCHLSWTL